MSRGFIRLVGLVALGMVACGGLIEDAPEQRAALPPERAANAEPPAAAPSPPAKKEADYVDIIVEDHAHLIGLDATHLYWHEWQRHDQWHMTPATSRVRRIARNCTGTPETIMSMQNDGAGPVYGGGIIDGDELVFAVIRGVDEPFGMWRVPTSGGTPRLVLQRPNEDVIPLAAVQNGTVIVSRRRDSYATDLSLIPHAVDAVPLRMSGLEHGNSWLAARDGDTLVVQQQEPTVPDDVTQPWTYRLLQLDAKTSEAKVLASTGTIQELGVSFDGDRLVWGEWPGGTHKGFAVVAMPRTGGAMEVHPRDRSLDGTVAKDGRVYVFENERDGSRTITAIMEGSERLVATLPHTPSVSETNRGFLAGDQLLYVAYHWTQEGVANSLRTSIVCVPLRDR